MDFESFELHDTRFWGLDQTILLKKAIYIFDLLGKRSLKCFFPVTKKWELGSTQLCNLSL